MKDLYSKHPDPAKGDHWLYRGRSDDIIVFSTGEKLNPTEMESIICANPVVSGALIAGLGRFQSSLLVEAVEPPSSVEEEGRLLELIWPSVQIANKKSPSHGVIHRTMIAFTSAAKPMLRAGKGSVQRKVTLDAYASEIDSLYKAGEASARQSIKRSGERLDNIGTAIKNIISTNTNINIHAIPADTDLFELGLDSLQVTTIAQDLTDLLSAHNIPQSIEAKMVYSHPNLAALTDAVLSIKHGRNPKVENHQIKLEELYRRYSTNMPISARKTLQKDHQSPSIVLMTGSTGSLGSYVLDSLQNDDQVAQIYCLCRGPNSFERQQSSQASKGLRPLSDKVRCLDTELSNSYFGLETDVYRELLNQVTHIIHNAWQVDFNLSIHSFERHIDTVRQLIDFSSHSRFGAKVFFVSSISSVSGLRGSVAEQVYTDWDTPEANGYGQSKFLAERLLDAAAREADIPCTIYRVGQVAGPTTSAGVWPTKEWLPSLIASSKYLSKIPSSLGRLDMVDWIPVDILGRSVVELAIHAQDSHHSKPEAALGATVYHAANPNRTTWDQIVPIIVRHLSQEKTIESVPLEVWIGALRESASRSDEVALNPATKLLTFFENLVGEGCALLSTEHTLSVSQVLSTVGPVRDEWVENWMKQWAF
ncbi:male sterility protein-domain-containing protein [Xylariaceae sp. AK1471]|nr:male sterility protein-domain-containing protein [Xylariaceae sp. AK1471]